MTLGVRERDAQTSEGGDIGSLSIRRGSLVRGDSMADQRNFILESGDLQHRTFGARLPMTWMTRLFWRREASSNIVRDYLSCCFTLQRVDLVP